MPVSVLGGFVHVRLMGLLWLAKDGPEKIPVLYWWLRVFQRAHLLFGLRGSSKVKVAENAAESLSAVQAG